MKINPRNIYYIFDQPVQYKALTLYPVRIKDYIIFQGLASCLSLEKNSIKDPVQAVKAISMSYLQYMFLVSDSENNIIQLFVGLMALVLGKKDDKDFEIKYWNDGTGGLFLDIDGNTYDSYDVDVLREIISEQNMYELPDETIQKEVREKIEEARKYREKLNKSGVASMEDQIIALSLYSGWDLEKIYGMTIRKFLLSIRRANHMIHSNIYLTASMSGFVTFKNKSALRGWLADLEDDDRNSDVTISLESVQNKVNFNEAMEK